MAYEQGGSEILHCFLVKFELAVWFLWRIVNR